MQAPQDWQILQQEPDGSARLHLAGHWDFTVSGRVELRVVRQDTGIAPSAALDWHAARETREDGYWEHEMAVPAGGLYRLETRFNPKGNQLGEWSARGDMRHFLGVGDVWLLAGQSNAAGYGLGAYADPPELGLHVLRLNGHWELAAHPLSDATGGVHAPNSEKYNPGHSPFLHFARLLRAALGHPIGLVPVALGGSPLAPWNPAEAGPSALFDNMVERARACGGIKGLVWFQGESDGEPGLAESYGERFRAAVASWREALGNARIPVLTAQINRYYPSKADVAAEDEAWSRMREAQRQAAHTIDGLTVTPTFDLPLCDIVHLSPEGNLLLARRLADCALSLAYGKEVFSAAPDVREAEASADREVVVLRFDNVKGRMDCLDRRANSFRVVDARGEVPIRKVVYPLDNSLRLLLDRPLEGAARVHGGYGVNPPSVPVDAERLMPMLGFFGLPVGEPGR